MRMVHWLEHDDRHCTPRCAKLQLEELQRYLKDHPTAKATGYRKTTGDMFVKIVRLECDQNYNDLDLDVNSGFDKSMRRFNRKPSNIEYSAYVTWKINDAISPIRPSVLEQIRNAAKEPKPPRRDAPARSKHEPEH